jgi:hypothetical protein
VSHSHLQTQQQLRRHWAGQAQCPLQNLARQQQQTLAQQQLLLLLLPLLRQTLQKLKQVAHRRAATPWTPHSWTPEKPSASLLIASQRSAHA